VNVTGLPVRLPEVTETVFVPGVGPSVNVLEANPAVVLTVPALITPPPAVTVKVTVIPDTALPFVSVTFTTNGVASCRPVKPVWPFPLTSARVETTGVAMPVALNVVGLPANVPDATVTVFILAAAPRVKRVEANPCALLETELAERVPPPVVTAKATVTPETPVPLASLTWTVNGRGSGLPTVPL
jgi:hypothetical protein